MPTLEFVWRPLAAPRPPQRARYIMHFDDREKARSFMERVLEGRAEAKWSVMCEDRVRRTLGGAVECYCKS